MAVGPSAPGHEAATVQLDDEILDKVADKIADHSGSKGSKWLDYLDCWIPSSFSVCFVKMFERLPFASPI